MQLLGGGQGLGVVIKLQLVLLLGRSLRLGGGEVAIGYAVIPGTPSQGSADCFRSFRSAMARKGNNCLSNPGECLGSFTTITTAGVLQASSPSVGTLASREGQGAGRQSLVLNDLALVRSSRWPVALPTGQE